MKLALGRIAEFIGAGALAALGIGSAGGRCGLFHRFPYAEAG